MIPAYVGIIGLTASFIVWAATPTHLHEPIFIGAFLTLMGFGAGAKALEGLRQPPLPPTPPTDPAEGVGRDAKGQE